MEQLTSQDPRSYSLYFDLKIWFPAQIVTGTFEKRAPGPLRLLSIYDDSKSFYTRLFWDP